MRYRRFGFLATTPQAFFTLEMGEAPLVFEAPYTKEGESAVVCVRGMLTHHKESPSLDSYDCIKSRVQAAFDSDCQSVVLKLDSLGGDVSGCFDLAKWIGDTAAIYGKRVLSYVDGHAASAAYALACSADTIGVSLTGFVGSVGVINAICDQSAADAAMGIRFVFATSGARKADGNPHVPVSDDTIATLQNQVDELAVVFYNHVSARRGLSVEQVAGFEAGLFFGEGAVRTRLADRVCSWAEMIQLATESPQPKQVSTTMPKYLEQMKELAVKMAVDGDDEEKASAKKMLAALEPEKEEAAAEDSEEAPASKKEDAAKAAAEEDAKKAAAFKSAAEESEKKAAARAHDTFAVAKELHELKAKLAAKEDAEARAAMFATRPDFDAKTRKMLNDWPVAQVKAACETFPRIATPAAASQVVGTRGAGEGAPSPDMAHIRNMMYGARSNAGVHKDGIDGRDLVFEDLTVEQARAILAKNAGIPNMNPGDPKGVL